MAQIMSSIVKPSSPTPSAFKIHKLSFCDQNASPIDIPLIFFYQNNHTGSKQQHDVEIIRRRLKESLSQILTVFYPLAGTVNQNSHVDCNDSGAEFLEARVRAHLQQFTQNPNMDELRQFLPARSSSHAILRVKASIFDCGGFSVGICLSHKVADAASAVAFVTAWAETCRKTEEIIRPSFDMSLRFPPIANFPQDVGMSRITEEKMKVKRFVFDSEKMEKLRREASNEEVIVPSRVEAVSVFIWRSFIQAKKPEAKTTSFSAAYNVNLRPRAVPPIPDHTFGNCITLATAVATSSSEDEDDRLATKVREAIRGVDGDYINNVLNNYEKMVAILIDSTGDVLRSENTCGFSSWLGFRVYEVDFGWGKPVWVGSTPMPLMNLVVLMETPDGDGVEALINFPEDHNIFQMLQHNYNNIV